MNFLTHMDEPRNINLFYYRNHGSAHRRVRCGIKVPQGGAKAFQSFLDTLGYSRVRETDNPAYWTFHNGAS